MLNSSNQYLRPEYLSPLPTTLDAKKSPLALLAQTCSNIGADNPNNKPILPSLEKSKDSSNDKKDKSPVIVNDDSNNKPSFKPYESITKKEDNNNSNEQICGKKTPSSKRSSPVISSRSPAASIGSCGKLSPAASDSGSSSLAAKSESGSLSSLAVSSAVSSSSSTTCTSQNTLSGLGYSSTGSLGLELGRNDSKDALSAMSLGLNAYKAALNGLSPLANCSGCGPIPGHPLPVDAVSTAHTYPSSIATQSGALKASYPLGAGGLSPYVGYARVKTASGGTTLVPVCRDPYCTNCQLSMQNAQLSKCPSGCTQCNHERLAPASLGIGHSTGLVPGLSGSAAAMAAAAAAASAVPGLSYPHSLLPRPNVCSWVIGDTFCGKMFSSSEELLQHVRTHTNISTSESPLSLIPPVFSLASGNLGAACHLHYSTATSLTTPAGLRRAYPTSLSPVSSLSAASRYHPYKSPLSTFPGTPLPPLAHPGLGVYYSPYSLYGQRLGPPVHP